MLLAVDIGNTNIVVALYDNDSWCNQKRVKTKNSNAIEEFRSLVHNFVKEKGSFNKAVVSSVVPSLTSDVVSIVKESSNISPVIVSREVETGLIKSSLPEEIGSDLICNMAAAHNIYPNDYVTVADFGTAFTTSTISPEGKVLGVTIGPGMMTSVKALFENTEQLPEIRLDLPKSVLGLNSIDSIRAGVLYGFTGQITAIVAQIEKELGHKVKVIATGGFSRYVTDFVHVDRANMFHTMDGARLICELNSLSVETY